ncbi:geranylgeranyl reductase [Desulfurococcus amylolyticus 1221n]|uniref:Geranylgeranyl reductase n=1 Tax=Desulfurococcus amylolyticus (strain DSM 18924 / JCM 16383 / VKM B-2413 / 1221n) TaxID=490899 RepID=B8D2U1_DESA1|nr:NAD(P)/FAD-dependent oxidoreductase [Desulfurococcus amylolyticus]ACL10488.1 geranylgeranyl reductase [Desulfurococcus amylolyticus 1221n]
MKYDVVVVGAGVAGLYSSLVLASKGFRVALVESKPASKIGDKTCGDAIGVHHFQHIGLKLPEDIIDHVYRGVKIYSPSERHEIIVPGEGVSVNRVKLGQWLLKQAFDRGVELLDQHSVIGVNMMGDRVGSIIAKKVGGGTVELEAEAFIDASGSKPALRSRLPETWPISDKPYTTDFNIAYREVVEYDGGVREEDRDYAVIYLNTIIAPGGYWWLFPKSRDGRVINVGLGVIWNGLHNPRHNYDKHLRQRFNGKVLHAGGGIVPTRRPLPTMVWRNVGVVGDAAYTVNPVHGGGIGSSLEAADIVARHVGDALEQGEVSEKTMWEANIEYMRAYGAKQAGLDILRMYMQKLSNEDFEWLMANKIVDGASVYDIGVKGELGEKITHMILSVLRALSRPSLLNQLRIVRNYMKKASELYLDKYPSTPNELPSWMRMVEDMVEEYRRIIGFNKGERVKW